MSSTSYETLRFDRAGGLATVTLARPQAANALDPKMADELLDVALHCWADRSVRAVLLTAEGRFFCAGGDLAAFESAGDGMPEMIKRMTVSLHAAVSHFVRSPAPVVAAVGGAAAGAGLALVCAADLVVAGRSAKFTLAYTRAGLTPDGSSTWFLPRLIGRRRALELVLTNRTLGAEEALAWGLVTRVVEDEAVEEEALALARQLAAGPTLALGRAKELLVASERETLESQMELESRAIAESASTADAREGIAAFLAKRKPEFEGR